MKDTQKLTFSIAKFSEDTAVAVAEALEANALPGIPAAASAGAGRFLGRELSKQMLASPKEDPFVIFTRLARAYPESVKLVVGTYLLGNADCGDAVTEEA